MRIKVSNFKLGMFIIAGTTLLVVMVVMFGAGAFSKPGLPIETYIDGSVQGLDIGSPLKYRGVTIGRVKEIALIDQYYPVTDPRYSRYVCIRMEIDPQKQHKSTADLEKRIDKWVEQGMRLRMASQGITGVVFMEADFIDTADVQDMPITWTPSVHYIPSSRSQLARVADSIEAIARDLQNANIPEIAANVDRLLTTTNQAVADANIKTVSAQLSESLERVRDIAAKIDDIAADPKLKEIGPKTVTTIENVDRTVVELRATVAQVGDDLTEMIGETQAAVGDVRDYLDKPQLDDAFERLGEIARSLEATLARVEDSFAQKDEQVDLILLDMRAVSVNLRDLTELISQYPSLAAFGTSPKPSEVYKND